MTTIRTGTCPQCMTRTHRGHCPKVQCDWFVCLGCKVVFDRKGRSKPKLARE